MSDIKKVDVTKAALLEQATKAVSIDELNKRIEEIVNLVISKNHDYGDAWQRYGVFTPLIRINDKTLRLETLSGSEALVADENVKDTLRDIIGYALLALLWLDNRGLIQNMKRTNVLARFSSFADYQEKAQQLRFMGLEPDNFIGPEPDKKESV